MENNITLKQGLESFRRKNAKYFTILNLSEEGKLFLDGHDVAHVVFGCDVTMYGEGIVKIWTTFGTNLGFWEVTKGYNNARAFSLARKFSIGHVFKNIFNLLAHIPLVIIRSKQMNKRWPFNEYQPYLDTPISEIRKEFNIRVL